MKDGDRVRLTRPDGIYPWVPVGAVGIVRKISGSGSLVTVEMDERYGKSQRRWYTFDPAHIEKIS